MQFNFPKPEQFHSAQPYEHVVIDNFVQDENLLREVASTFPDCREVKWAHFNNKKEKKMAYDDIWSLTSEKPELAELCLEMISPEFTKTLAEFTGIEGLTSDQAFMGGGLHRIEPTGFLDVHTDFNFHPHLKKRRVLNILLFLNEDWEESYGGHLELWEKDVKKCAYRVLPKFNRAVIFKLSDTSWHGHPVPLSCPKGMCRKSIALYYYAGEMPRELRSTVFTQVNDKTGRNQSITI